MGDYVVAFAEHALATGAPLPTLRLAQVVTPVLERHREEFERWWMRRPEWPISVPVPDFAWHIVESAEFPEMRGPFNIRIEIGPQLASVHLPMKWAAFLEGGPTGAAVRETIEAIRAVLESGVIACVSDAFDNWSLDDAEMASMDDFRAVMRLHAGPPHPEPRGDREGESQWFIWRTAQP